MMSTWAPLSPTEFAQHLGVAVDLDRFVKCHDRSAKFGALLDRERLLVCGGVVHLALLGSLAVLA